MPVLHVLEPRKHIAGPRTYVDCAGPEIERTADFDRVSPVHVDREHQHVVASRTLVIDVLFQLESPRSPADLRHTL